MSFAAIAVRRPVSRLSGETLLLASCAVAASVFVGLFGLQSRHALLHEALPVLLVPLALWLFFSERYEVTLAVLLVYLGLLDGVIKLESGSTFATLGRDVLLYAIALGALARTILRKERISSPPLLLGVLAWVVVCLMQLANPANVSLLHAASGLRQHLEFVPLFFLGYMVLRSERHLTGFLVLLVFVAAVNGIVSLAQWQMTPQQLAGWGPGYATLISGTAHLSGREFVEAGIAHVRPPALGSDMGFGGALGTLALPGLMALLTTRGLHWRIGWILTAVTPLVILAVWTSQARTAVVSSVIAVIAFLGLTLTSRRGAAVLVVTATVGLTGYFAITGLAASAGSSADPATRYQSITPGRVFGTAVSYRTGTIALVPTYMTKYPLGAGIGSVGPASGVSVGGSVSNVQLDAESEFTFLLIETGIPGLFALTVLTLAVIAIGVRLRSVANVRLQRSLMALTAVLIAIFVSWLIGPASASSPGSPFFWAAAGALAYWYGELRAGRTALRLKRLNMALVRR